MTKVIKGISAALASSVVVLLAATSARLFVADILAQRPTLAARETALKLFPGSVSYALALADLRRQSDLDVREQLTDAARADPADARLFVQLGLECERAGDLNAAQRYLEEAARLSREFLPRWTLANYYFRQDNQAAFLMWMRRALDIGTPELQPSFQLLWRSGLDADRIRATIPVTHDVMVAYLAWLVGHHENDAAWPIAATVLDHHWGGDAKAVLSTYCALLSDGREEQRRLAADLWNRLFSSGILTQSPVFPASAPHIVDANFSQPLEQPAFGWRANSVSGILISSSDPGVRLEFDGSEPENTFALTQLLSLRPGSEYVLDCGYESRGIPADSGLFWQIQNPDTHTPFPQEREFLSDARRQLRAHFTTPPDCRFGRLMLVYARQPGTVRISGSVLLKHVQLHS